MPDTLTSIDFRPLVIPRHRRPDAADFREMVRIRNIVYREISGHDDGASPGRRTAPRRAPDEYQPARMWVVIDAGRLVGRVGVELPSRTAPKSPSGSSSSFGRCGAAASAPPPTSSSSAPRASTAARFCSPGRSILPPPGPASPRRPASARSPKITPRGSSGGIGYSLEQVERNSAFDLTGSFDERRATARRSRSAASGGYRVVQWFAPTPPEYVAGYAWMKSRMSTDAPAADLEFDEEPWDAARIAQHDASTPTWDGCSSSPPRSTSQPESYAPSTSSSIGKDRTEASQQEDTLVLQEHRGHKLGTLVKCAGLLPWRELAPDSPRVITYNAEENRPCSTSTRRSASRRSHTRARGRRCSMTEMTNDRHGDAAR